MKQFHPLKIERIERETADSVRIALAVPAEFEADYEFLPGQHLPFEISVDGRKVRRTYSICSGVDERPLEIGVRVQPGGAFSEYASSRLSVGDTLEAMPPAGHFHVDLDKGHAKGKAIQLKTALKGVLIPVHPGAAKFYKEKGMMK